MTLDVIVVMDPIEKIKIAKDFRGHEKPSDHVPVTATVEI